VKTKLPHRRRPRNYDGFESIRTILPGVLGLLNRVHREAERATRRPFTPEASQRLDRIDHAREALREVLVGEELVS